MLDGGPSDVPVPPTALPTEIIHVDDPVAACDGGGGALGHPRVWLRIVGAATSAPDARPQIMCPYCSRLYVLNDGAGASHGH